MNTLLRLNIVLLLIAAIFDPSDLFFHAKVPLFVGVWVLTVLDFIVSARGRYPVPSNLYFYIFIFAGLLPLIGMFVYVIRDGRMDGYEGFRYWKAYLFLTLCIPLAIKRIDLIRSLSAILSVLSVATIVLYALTVNNALLATPIAAFGDAFVIFSLTSRSYGNLAYESFYFHASPLLVVAIVYFCYRSLRSVGWLRLVNCLLLALNICGMLLSGTRNNMIVAILAPLMVVGWYKGPKAKLVICSLLLLVVAVGFSSGVIQAMLSADDYSNAIKLGHLHDYGVLFSDWRTLIFGQGLGATFFSTAWGTRVDLTELTYLEIIRNYGLVLAPILYGLILYPLRTLANPDRREDHYLFLGYFGYLYLCSANPLLLSSSGMLVLAVVLFKVFCGGATQPRLAPAINRVSLGRGYRHEAIG